MARMRPLWRDGAVTPLAALLEPVALLASVPLTSEGWAPMGEGGGVAVRCGEVLATRAA